MHYVHIVLFALFSHAALAKEANISGDVSIGTSASFSLFTDELANQEAFGFELFTGVKATDSLKFELGYADYAPASDEVAFSPWFVRAKTGIPVSDKAELYLGGGVGYDQSLSPSLSAGVNYQLSDHWYSDVGYQASFLVGPERREHYTFNVSLVYQFGGRTAEPVLVNEVSMITPSQSAQYQTVTNQVERKEQNESRNVALCADQSEWHEVRQGEYLLLIAERYELSLEALLVLNPMFIHRNIDLIYPSEWLVVTNHCNHTSQ